ncbi:hypothetical protein NC652_033988 [Populus alba x Populus x berolinensis]|uniref:Uncharacterized protein n=1 Tax=Populus alba x Populus x berolinensis TaxID=444605 RepID=A0AAD6LV07_9ROSI|nr:hypothetical protein NC652_033988 [Populus alba x Populus x berolinensis]KAJ6973692.1 hypothetical protein NC653_033894 [Populus alba x Populus x berolinensis]
MPVFDSLEFRYTCMKNKRCSWWVRTGLAALIGGIALPLTLAYPCFMWISIKKPHQKGHGVMWCLNLGLGYMLRHGSECSIGRCRSLEFGYQRPTCQLLPPRMIVDHECRKNATFFCKC